MRNNESNLFEYTEIVISNVVYLMEKYRKKLGYRQIDMAKNLGVSLSTYKRVIKFEVAITLPMIARFVYITKNYTTTLLEKIFNIDIDIYE